MAVSRHSHAAVHANLWWAGPLSEEIRASGTPLVASTGPPSSASPRDATLNRRDSAYRIVTRVWWSNAALDGPVVVWVEQGVGRTGQM
jgi:hypothetical protein